MSRNPFQNTHIRRRSRRDERLLARALLTGLAIGWACTVGARAGADGTPPPVRWVSTGAKGAQQSVCGRRLDTEAPAGAPATTRRADGVRSVRSGPKQPITVGHLGGPGCLEVLEAAGFGIQLDLRLPRAPRSQPRARPPLRHEAPARGSRFRRADDR